MRVQIIFHFLLTTVLTVVCANAQGKLTSPYVGETVRVTAPTITSDTILGKLIAVEGDTVTIKRRWADTLARLPLASLVTVQVCIGHKSAIRPLAAVGMLLGGVYQFAIREPERRDEAEEKGGTYKPSIPRVFLYAGIGGVTGALIGSLITTSKWDSIAPSSLRIKPALTLAKGDVGVNLVLSF